MVSIARAVGGCCRLILVACCVGLVALATAIASERAFAACPNEPARTGLSAELPDCRAYELVTPANSGGHEITGNHNGGEANAFATDRATSSGDSFVFELPHGGLPEFPESTGTNDIYESIRTSGGWKTVRRLSPTGEQAVLPVNGGISPDHQYMSEQVGPPILGQSGGTLGETSQATYVGLPDGSFELLGKGSLGVDPLAIGKLITAGGSHIIFVSSSRLEPQARRGVTTIYDRSIGGPTHVVSLLPGNAATNEAARYLGASADGRAVAFDVAETLYVRVDDSSTEKVATGEAVFAGLTAHGEWLFYMHEGNPFAFDVATGTTDQLTTTGDAQLVNIAPDGARAYFISFSQLDGSKGVAGEPNLYAWHSASQAINFVATLSGEDLSGFPALNTWTGHVVGEENPVGPGADSSRLTPDGSVLLFESAAKLTDYENEGHTEIYRYDDLDHTLICLSCNEGVPPTGDARLENISPESEPQFVWSQNIINNLSEGGDTAFFETDEALARRDVDGSNDIYEWSTASGIPTVSLISSGQTPGFPGPKAAPAPNVIVAITPDGQNVFFNTVDPLVSGAGTGGVPATYDARVNGGFLEEVIGGCEGEGCQPVSPPQGVSAPVSSQFEGRGNVKPRRCVRKATKAKGKSCVRKRQHHKKKHRHRHGGRKKGAGK